MLLKFYNKIILKLDQNHYRKFIKIIFQFKFIKLIIFESFLKFEFNVYMKIII